MEIVLILSSVLLIIIGIIGSIVPALPGPILAYAGVWCYHFSSINNKISLFWHVVFGIFFIITIIGDYVIPAIGTKKFGGTKYGVWGSTLGLIIGLFFPPFGILIGPFVGAFVLEYLMNKDHKLALKSATGSFLGFLFGTVMKIFICFIYLGYICIDLTMKLF